MDIFKFWSGIGRDAHIHPRDEAVFKRLSENGHRFNHNSLPGCFMGRLRDAPVVLLFMSPGFSPEDEVSANDPEWQDWHFRQRSGYEPLPDVKTPAGQWWTKRVKVFGLTPAIAASRVAFLNIGSYKSREMYDPELLAALPSSRATLDWAQQELFPSAEAGDRVVVCLRATKFWGLHAPNTYGKSLFVPKVNRAGDMLKKDPRDEVMREAIIEAVKRAVA